MTEETKDTTGQEDDVFKLNTVFNIHRNAGMDAVEAKAKVLGYTEQMYCMTCECDTPDVGNVCPICMEEFEEVC